ncbi:leucine-rich repeat-containing protein 31 isoform X3 [Alligator mississippiensis]|uniref:leucine-rich repeat-containing protein 31 isoform X3 n=1 Tax=Alligator mississippiensis TaxID=8496 RepID=UPI002877AE29|nr:leucine-rich repeat-containing protein 31 isoform X3 [Alligator mississippiensis]
MTAWLEQIATASPPILQETAQDPQNGYEEGLLKRSPFHLFMTQIQRIKSSVGKGKHQHSSVIQFFSDLDPGGKKKGETEEEEIDLSRPNNQNEKPTLPASAEVSHNISETDLVSGKWKVKQFMKKLGKKPNSKNMDLNNCALNETDLMELSGLLLFLPELEEINLSWNDCIGGTLKPLTLQLHHVNKLKSLRLNNCSLTAEDIASLGEALEIIPFLEELDLSWNTNIGGKLSLLTKKIQKGSKIKILKVIDCNLAAKDGESLDTAFQYLLELRKLDLSCNREIGRGFEDSAAHLANLKDLEVLDLHQCCVTEEDLAVLTQVIPLLSSLQELNLSSNKNIGMSLDHLLSRLRFLPKLKSVIISNCSLQKASFASLADAALHLPELEILDLSWNKCVGGNLKLLLEALKLATKIRVLILSSCNLAAGDLALLALLMRTGHLAKLQKLDLSYNDTVCDEGWATFYQDLAELKELSELDVSLRPSSCRDCGMWFGKLLTALPEMPAFTELGMQRWVFSGAQQKQLEYFNRDNTRNVRFDYRGQVSVSL